MKIKEEQQVKDVKMFVVEKMVEKRVRGDRGKKEVKDQLGGRYRNRDRGRDGLWEKWVKTRDHDKNGGGEKG